MSPLSAKSIANSSAATLLDELQDIIAQAKKAGADAADAIIAEGTSLSVSWRNRTLESLDRAEGTDLGLRVLIGKQQAIVSTSDRRPATLRELVSRAVAMAKAAPEDPFCGIADPSEIARRWPQLELGDTYDISAEKLILSAKTAEEAALAVKGVSQCESTDASAGETAVYFAASNGFVGHYRRTSYGISAAVLAGTGTAMEQDYDYSSAVFLSDLADPAQIGAQAGERAVRKLNGRKMPSGRFPVVYDPRIASSMLGHLIGAISGPAIVRGTSYLKDSLGKDVFGPQVSIVDDPFRPRGLRSRLFDGEGLLPQRRIIIDQGRLTTWLLDLRSARQLGMASTAHASRSPGGLPSPAPSNLYLEPGPLSPAELIKDIKQGLYVTEMMGSGVNGVTGDYSRAASGFWIDNGVISFPVNEITLAGNLKDMFRTLTPANDLEFRHGFDSPTIRIEGMTLAGI
jgi:PmbA protein